MCKILAVFWASSFMLITMMTESQIKKCSFLMPPKELPHNNGPKMPSIKPVSRDPLRQHDQLEHHVVAKLVLIQNLFGWLCDKLFKQVIVKDKLS